MNEIDWYGSPVHPIKVYWTGTAPASFFGFDYFTEDGQFRYGTADPEYDITFKKRGKK